MIPEKKLTRRSGQDGFTVVELMIALAVFAIVIAAVGTSLSSALNTTRNNRHRSTAAHLAAQEMDTIRSADFATLPLGQVQSTANVDGIDYTILRESAWTTHSATTDPCTSAGGSVPAYMRVTVSVTWPNMSGTDPVGAQTLITPPVGSYSPTTGHIGVTVFDRDGLPAQGHVVGLSGPVITTQTTTTDGCAFFAYLPPGAYIVSLGTAGYVDGQGNPTPSQPASVTVSTTTSVQFDYDEAATLTLTQAGRFGGTIPASIPLALGNNKLLPTGTKVFPGTGNPRTIPGLFPYADGYQAWTGDCADSDPEGERPDETAFYPGATRGPAHSVDPGQTTTGTVLMGTTRVLVQRRGLPRSGVTVVARHAPDAGCPAGNLLTLGTTNLVGMLTTAIPYGNWTYEAVGFSPQTTWPSEINDPRQGSFDVVQVRVS